MVKCFRTDNGTEFTQHKLQDLFSTNGILHQRSVPYVPQQNARVERKHRHLIETARSLRIHGFLPLNLWGECILTATYLINLLPSSVLQWKTPF